MCSLPSPLHMREHAKHSPFWVLLFQGLLGRHRSDRLSYTSACETGVEDWKSMAAVHLPAHVSLSLQLILNSFSGLGTRWRICRRGTQTQNRVCSHFWVEIVWYTEQQAIIASAWFSWTLREHSITQICYRKYFPLVSSILYWN